MKNTLCLLLLWSLSIADTMANNDTWNTGCVTMPDGYKVDGQLNYNWKAEVLQVRIANGSIKAYSAGRISSFTFFDNDLNVLRKFSTVAFISPDSTERFIFMEECTIGTLSVYRRLRHSHELIKVARPSMFGSDREMIKDYDNFVYMVLDDKQVTDFEHFGIDLWPHMQKEFGIGKALAEYVKIRQLDITSTLAKLMIINQYNRLKIKEQEQIMADAPDITPAVEYVQPVEAAAAINDDWQ